MGRVEPEPVPATARSVVYVDADGQPTAEPEAAVRGEIVDYDAHGRPRGRMRFFLAEREIPWLPVSEPAFLLWVLAALMLVWIVIGLVLHFT
jgi:hypothetical protein